MFSVGINKEKAVRKILIIDDDEYSLLLISDFLVFNNFQVLTTENGWLGLQLAREQRPDLIICDVNMPVIDGYEVLRQLRNNLNTANIPVFFLTFEIDAVSRRCRALQLNPNGYLSKPVDLNELLAAIANYFRD